jgi:hypothetical protein
MGWIVTVLLSAKTGVSLRHNVQINYKGKLSSDGQCWRSVRLTTHLQPVLGLKLLPRPYTTLWRDARARKQLYLNKITNWNLVGPSLDSQTLYSQQVGGF